MDPLPDPNPYLSPRTATSGSLTTEDATLLGTYEPLVMPRDATDLLWTCLCGIVVVPVAYGIPLGVLALVRAPAPAMVGAVLGVVAIAVVCMYLGIRRIELTPEGLVADRRWLGPIVVPWREVGRLERASWGELLVTSMFRPHRCCSFSMTCHHQLTLRGPWGMLIFPPREYDQFVATIRYWGRQAAADFVDATVHPGG